MFEIVALIVISIMAVLALVIVGAMMVYMQKTNEKILNDMRNSKGWADKEKGS